MIRDIEPTHADFVVAAALQHPKTAFEVFDELSFLPDHAEQPHRSILSAIFDMHLAGDGVDCLTVVKHLKSKGALREGSESLLYWLDSLLAIEDAGNIRHHASKLISQNRFFSLALQTLRALRRKDSDAVDRALIELSSDEA